MDPQAEQKGTRQNSTKIKPFNSDRKRFQNTMVPHGRQRRKNVQAESGLITRRSGMEKY